MTSPILATKFYIPSPPPQAVSRPRLLDRLNAGLHGKLTLISAPAGYGKTTLAAEWVYQFQDAPDVRVCWLSLAEDDSDPLQFFAYLSAAMGSVPGVRSTLPKLLRSGQPTPARHLMAAFIHDVSAVSGCIYLVLDDYHAIASAAVEEAVSFLLQHMPPQMNLLLVSRTDPGFPLSRLRARGQLVELRADELRFTAGEAAEFLRRGMGVSLTSHQIAALEARTEGWIAGLQMAALSMRNRTDVDSFVASFTGSHRFIMDYLMEEVLAHQPAVVRDFLTKTAPLHHLCGELCDAVLAGIHEPPERPAQEILEQLEADNIFLVPLDEERRWYRYHHLFADLLRKNMSAELACAVRKQAARWSLEHNRTGDAIEYALAARDYEAAAPVLAEQGLSFLFRGKLATLQRWLDAFPDEFLSRHPRLCLHYGWVLLNQGRTDAVEPYLRTAELAAPDDNAIRAVTALIRGNIARTNEDIETALHEAQIALQLTPPENALTQGAALLQVGAVQIMTGKPATAVATLSQSLDLARQTQNLNVAFLSGGYLGLAHILLEELEQAETVLQNTQAHAQHLGLEQSPLLLYVHLGLAHLAFSKQALGQARSEVKQAVAHCRLTNEQGGLRCSLMLAALIEQAAGQRKAAWQAFEDARTIPSMLGNPEIRRQMGMIERTLHAPAPSPEHVKVARFLAAGAPLSYAQAAIAQTRTHERLPQALVEPLSNREQEILALIAAGRKNREIAEELVISLNTVLYHTKNIYGKLGVNKRMLAVRRAQELGLL
ncbi:LuxR C-terminal-related transcriptional regulator [Litorilinea aerophila]|nr:LuxR C-terminal-related transcriptional regulator [Litorilinea aerophila]MCC9075668.1 LuxR C-terminal-related transcriptional regulator [Litorilinea aerophila]